jgi:Cu(I)/Ag(I) efflux system membrane fusion protein
VAAFLLRRPLVAWFTGQPVGESAGQSVTLHGNALATDAGTTVAGGSGGGLDAPPSPRALAPVQYPPVAFDALRGAMDAYERLRAKLAGDDARGVAADAQAMADALRAVQGALPSGRDDLVHATAAAREAADRLAAAKAVDEARTDFAVESGSLLPLVGADARLTDGWHVFECPMYEGDPRWMQRSAGPDNPYMGTRMPSCGTSSSWQAPPPRGGQSGAAPGAIDHYTCSMHPSVRQAAPGTCPICGMTLVPVTREQQEQGVVLIDEGRRQLIGVRTEPVVSAPMRMTFRAVGHVTYDESALSDVNLKVRGWITKLYVNETGQRVSKGQPLFSMYSPELYNAEQDFLLGLQGSAASAAADSSSTPRRTDLLARASRQRLHLLGLSDAQIDAIAQSGKPSEDLAIASPASGFVIEKNVVEGASVEAGTRLYRVAALSKVWVDADVYESDLAHVRVGQNATVTLDYLPGRAYEAKVAYLYPYLDPTARTGRVRLELTNRELDLRPGMYASVSLSSDLGTRVQVPAAAVVYTGPRRLVFVDVGGGRFRPTEVQVGTESNGVYEVLGGISPGDQVATSGVFLIAAEARISTAARYWETTP